MFGYFAWKALIASSVAACLVSPPHQENFSSTGSPEVVAPAAVVSAAAAVVVSAGAAVVVSAVLLLPDPQADRDIAITVANPIAVHCLIFLIFFSPFSLPHK